MADERADTLLRVVVSVLRSVEWGPTEVRGVTVNGSDIPLMLDKETTNTLWRSMLDKIADGIGRGEFGR